MKRIFILRAMLMVTLLGSAALAVAETGFDVGKREYEASCAICHGINAKGDGVFGDLLQLAIPDLTTLSRRNGGVFPTERVYAMIDGREYIKAHGAREMPIWGNYLSISATPEYDDYPNLPEAFVRSRILSLIDFLNHRQVK